MGARVWTKTSEMRGTIRRELHVIVSGERCKLRPTMTTCLTAPAERCRDALASAGYRGCWMNPGEQVFDREQTPIRNLVVDDVCQRGEGMNGSAPALGRVMDIFRKGPFRARGGAYVC
jgi:hypothetical protein